MTANPVKKTLYATGLFILLVSMTCSPMGRYRVLSVFFDGVPNPEEEQARIAAALEPDTTLVAQTSRRPQFRQPEYILHAPYQKRECKSCHSADFSSRLLQPEPLLCYTCHEDFTLAYTYVHGPVAVGLCTNCHNPHQSKNEKLLKRAGQETCFYCHESDRILANEIHEDIGEIVCTECHNPHGGSDPFLLD